MKEKNSFRFNQNVTFSLIWLTYCVTYALRKPVGVVKPYLAAEFHLSNSELGFLDTALLLPYALVQIFFSSFWDGKLPKHIITPALIASSISMLLFCASPWYMVTLLCLFLNGAAQAPIWPACSKSLSSWFHENQMSSVFGIISTAPYVGALAGTGIIIYIQDWYHWRLGFVPAGVLGILISILISWKLETPNEGNSENQKTLNAKSKPGLNQTNKTGTSDSMSDIWKVTAVPELAAAIFCLKFVRYFMYMWLPMYLINFLGYSKAQGGIFSTMFDIGGIIGGPAIGLFVDTFFSSKPILGVYYITMISTMSFVALYLFSGFGSFYVCLILLVSGASNCGPDALLTGSIPMMIGENFAIGLGAGVTSLTNGIGSLGGIVEGPIIGFLSQHLGWSFVIFLMISVSFMTTLATLRAHLVTAVEEKNMAMKKEGDSKRILNV